MNEKNTNECDRFIFDIAELIEEYQDMVMVGHEKDERQDISNCVLEIMAVIDGFTDKTPGYKLMPIGSKIDIAGSLRMALAEELASREPGDCSDWELNQTINPEFDDFDCEGNC